MPLSAPHSAPYYSQEMINVELQLPVGVTCEQCVLQMTNTAGKVTFPSHLYQVTPLCFLLLVGIKKESYPLFNSSATLMRSNATLPAPTEEFKPKTVMFRNCADIAIEGNAKTSMAGGAPLAQPPPPVIGTRSGFGPELEVQKQYRFFS